MLIVAAFVSNAGAVTRLASFHISSKSNAGEQFGMIPDFMFVFHNIAEGCR